MPRYDDRRNITRLYVGHLSPRIRSRDLEDIFSRYGRVRDVDMKRDYAFVEFSDPRDADDAQYSLNGREIKGSRIVVEFSKGVPRAPGGGGTSSRDIMGKGPPPGSGRCFNCGIDGHWARDCKAGDWKNKCYRCGDRGHIERNCQNSPKKLSRGKNYSRSPSPRRYRSRSRSYSKSRSRSASPVKRGHGGRRSRSPRYSRSPVKEDRSLSPAPRGRKRSLTPEDRSPSPVKAARKRSPTPEEEERDHQKSSPATKKYTNGSDYSGSPRGGGRGRSRSRSRSPMEDAPVEEEDRRDYKRRSPAAAVAEEDEENGRSSRSPSPAPADRKEDDSDNEMNPTKGGSE